MPRQGRLHIVGGCYHVMGRGLGGASLSWKVKEGEISQADLLAVASGSVSPGCGKKIAGGQ